MAIYDTEAARRYHELTKHSYLSIRSSRHFLDYSNMPATFKVYRDLEALHLPRDLQSTDVSALDAVGETTGERPRASPRLESLATLLYHSAGVTKRREYPGGTIHFRAAACAGALYPVEVYVVNADIPGLEAGVYHFGPRDLTLTRLRGGDHRKVLVEATGNQADVAVAPIVLVFSAISWRSSWKYRDRAYRYHFWDNGMIAANALALAGALGLQARVVLGFVDSEVSGLVGIDGERELPLSLLTLGSDAPASVDVARPPVLQVTTEPLSASEVDYPEISEMHHASEIESPAEVGEWRVRLPEIEKLGDGGALIPIERGSGVHLPDESIESVIERRASTRRFANKSIPFSDLSAILEVAARGVSADLEVLKSDPVNDLYLIVHRVDGLSPGAYFYHRRERALELLKEGDFSQRSAYLTLEQPLGGDGSVTFYFMADLDRVQKAWGNRGYRVVQMESAITGGRIYLASYALRRGATGLTFYDDEVTQFFSPHAEGKSCIFVTAIGVPGRRPLH